MPAHILAKYRLAILPLCIHAVLSSPAWAGPAGGEIKGGSGSISHHDNVTTIVQRSDRMAIDWQSYDVGVNERVAYVQPDASSISLNRIMSNGGSQVHGRIDANGQVILVNTHGIMFGENSVINAGGILASGLSIDTSQFMNGDFTFRALEGADGTIISKGLINAATGGSVALLGTSVVNEGLVSANLGSVTFASGREAVVTFGESGFIGVRVNEAMIEGELGMDSGVINTGDINAEGGKVLLSASTSRDIFSDLVSTGDLDYGRRVRVHDDGSFDLGAGSDIRNTGRINTSGESGGEVLVVADNITHSGEILADSYTDNLGGYVELHSANTTMLSGDSLVSVNSVGDKGGGITLLGQHVGLVERSEVRADGAGGGGQILVGGDQRGDNLWVPNASRVFLGPETLLSASASASAVFDNTDGGKVVVWADDDLRAYGQINADASHEGRGGFVETSSRVVDLDPNVSVKGFEGQWLIDPLNVLIQNGGAPVIVGSGPADGFADVFRPIEDDSIVTVSSLAAALAGGNSVLIETSDGGLATGGNITLNSDLDISNNGEASLTLRAHNDITFNASISNLNVNEGGSLSLNLIADSDISGVGSITIAPGESIATFGRSFNASGVDFTNNGTLDVLSDSDGGNISLNMSGNVNELGFIRLGGSNNTGNTSTFTVVANTIFIGENIRDGGNDSIGANVSLIQFDARGDIVFDSMSLDNNGDNITQLTLNADTDNNNDGDVVLQNNASLFLNGGDFLANGHNLILSAASDANRIATEGGSFQVGSESDRLSGSFDSRFDRAEFTTFRNQDRTGNVSIFAAGNIDIGRTESSTNTGNNWDYDGSDLVALNFDALGDITLHENFQIDRFTGTNNGNSLTFNAGGALDIQANIVQTGSDNSAMTFMAGTGGFVNIAAINSNGRDINIGDADTASATFSADITGQSLNVTTTGAILATDGVNINVAGPTILSASAAGDILLDSTSISLGGDIQVLSGRNVTLVNNGDIDFRASVISGDLSLIALGDSAIEDLGTIQVVGASSFVAEDNTIAFNNVNNDFGAAVSANGLSLILNDINDLVLADVILTGVDARNAITAGGVLTQITGDIITSGGDINLTALSVQSNDINTAGTNNNDGGAVVIAATGLDATADAVRTGLITSSGGEAQASDNRAAGLNAGDVGVTATGEINIVAIAALGTNPDDQDNNGNNGNSGRGGDVTIDSTAANVAIGSIITNGGNGEAQDTGNNDDASGGDAGDISISANTGNGSITLAGDLLAQGGHVFDNTNPAIGVGHGEAGNITLTGDIVLAESVSIDTTLNDLINNAASAPYTPGFVTITGDIRADADTNSESLLVDAGSGVVSLANVSTAATANGAFGGHVTLDGSRITVGAIDTSGRDGADFSINAGGNGGDIAITVTTTDQAVLTVNGDINTEAGTGDIAGVTGSAILTFANGASSGLFDLRNAGIFTSNVTINGSDSDNDELQGPSDIDTPVFWTTLGSGGRLGNAAIASGVATFSGLESLVGGNGVDNFTLNSSVANVDGGEGADIFTLFASVLTSIDGGGDDDVLNLATTTGTHEWVINESGGGTLAGGFLDGGVNFSSIQTLNGSDGGIDRFRLIENVGTGNRIDARGSVNDSLIVTSQGTQTIGFGSSIGGIDNLETITAEGDANDFILELADGSTDNSWLIDGENQGSISSPDGANTIRFVNFSTLLGNRENDTFSVSNGASVGRINGQGGNDRVDFSAIGTAIHVMVDERLGAIDATFTRVANIETIQAPEGSSAAPLNNILSLTSASSSEYTWTFFDVDGIDTLSDGLRDGQLQRTDVVTSPINYIDFDTFNGGDAQDTFVINTQGVLATINGGTNTDQLMSFFDATSNDWLVDTLNGGDLNYFVAEINGAIGFSSIEAIFGGDRTPDRFSFSGNGSISGVAGEANNVIDTVDYSASNDNRTINIGGDIDGIIGIERIVGNASASNTLTGNTRFFLWDITGSNSGEVFNENRTDSVIFENFGNLVGSAANDQFTLLGNAALPGTIADIRGGSGTNILSGGSLGRTWFLGRDTTRRVETLGVASVGVFNGIQTINAADNAADIFIITQDNNFNGRLNGGIGNGVVDVLRVESGVGSETQWHLGASTDTFVSRVGLSDIASFTGFESIEGGAGADIFSVQNAFVDSVLSMDGVGLNDGDIVDVSALPVNSDTFVLQIIDSDNTVTLSRNDALMATVRNIERVQGRSGSNVFLQSNIDLGLSSLSNTWTVSAINGTDGENDGQVEFINAGVQTTLEFENIAHFLGGDGSDDFTMASGASLNGSIDGLGGDNSLFYDDDNLVWRLGAQVFAGTVSDVAFSNIQTVTGNNTNSTLVGPVQNNLWTVSGANEGRVALDDVGDSDSLNFFGISSLHGNTSRDRFVVAIDGRISGTILGTQAGGTNNIDDSLSVNSALGDAQAWSIDDISSVSNGALNRVAEFAQIERIIGGAGDDIFTIEGLNQSLRIDAANNGVVSNLPSGDQLIWQVGSTGANYFISDSLQTLNRLGDASSPQVTFSNIEAVFGSDTGNDQFDIRGGSVKQVRGGDGSDTFIVDTNINPDIHIEIHGGIGATDDDILVAGNRDNTWLLGGDALSAGTLNFIDSNNRGVVFVGFETLRGNNANDNFVLRSGSAQNIDGGQGLGKDSLEVQRAANAGGPSQWFIDGVNSGNVSGQIAQFTQIENLIGGEGIDVFQFTDINASISGLIRAGEVSNFQTDPLVEDTLNLSIFTDGVVLGLGPIATSGSIVDGAEVLPTVYADEFESVLGAPFVNDISDQNDQWLVMATDRNLRWVLDDVPTTNLNQGSVEELDVDGVTAIADRLVSFENFGSLQGGDGIDDENIQDGGGNLSGEFRSGAGGRRLRWSGFEGLLVADLSVDIISLEGNGNTLVRIPELADVSLNGGNTWTINGENQVTFSADYAGYALSFTGVNQIEGGLGQDIFTFTRGVDALGNVTSGQLIDGFINGGGGPGDRVEVVNATQDLTFGLSRLRESPETGPFGETFPDVLSEPVFLAENQIGVIDLVGIDRLNVTHLDPSNPLQTSTLVSAETGNYRFDLGSVDTVGLLSNSDTQARLEFFGVDFVRGGAANDVFVLTENSTVNGLLDGGGGRNTVNLSALASVRVELGNTAGVYLNIDEFVGNGLDSTIRGADIRNVWTIDNVNAGFVVDNGAERVDFTGFNVLEGGDLNDIFTINSGTIRDGVYGGFGDDELIVNLGFNQSIGSSFVGGASGDIYFYGGSGINSTLVNGGSERARFDGAYLPSQAAADRIQRFDFSINQDSLNQSTRIILNDVGLDGLGSVTDNVYTSVMSVNALSSQADTFTIADGRFDISGFGEVLSRNNESLTVVGEAQDTVVIDGLVELGGTFRVINAAVEAGANNARIVTGEAVSFTGTTSLGSSVNRLSLDTNQLFLEALRGDAFLDMNGSVDIAQLSSPAGIIDMSASGSVNASGALSSINNIRLVSNENIVLNEENSLSGTLDLFAGGDITLTNGVTHFHDVSAQNLTLNTRAGVNDSGVINITNSLNIHGQPTSAIVLDGEQNQLNIVNINEAGRVLIHDSSSDGLSISGFVEDILAVTAEQNIVANAMSAQGILLTSSEGSIATQDVLSAQDRVSLVGRSIRVNDTITVAAGTGDSVLVIDAGAPSANNSAQVNIAGRLLANSTSLGNIYIRGGRIEQSVGAQIAGRNVLVDSADEVILAANIEASETLSVRAQADITMNNGAGENQTQAQTITFEAGNNILTRALNADSLILTSRQGGITQQADINATTTFINALNGEFESVVGSTLMLAAGESNVNVQSAQLSGDMAGDGTLIMNLSDRWLQSGDITVEDFGATVGGDIVMAPEVVISSQTDVDIEAGQDITLAEIVAEQGRVSLSSGAAIVDNNSGATNITANDLTITAESGVGGSAVDGRESLNISVANVNVLNNLGGIGLINDQDVRVTALISNGDIYFQNTDGNVVMINDDSRVYDRDALDARAAGGVINANYNSGLVTLDIANGYLDATPGPFNGRPELVGDIIAVSTTQGFGVIPRRLVVFARTQLIVSGPGIEPLWGFNQEPLLGLLTDTDLLDVSINANLAELLVSIEDIEDVNPAVFTNLRNFSLNDMSIRLPRDQYYNDDDDDLDESYTQSSY